MKKFFFNSTTQIKAIIISLCFLIVLNLCLIPLFIVGYKDIVFGLDIGIILQILYLFVDNLISKNRNRQQNITLTVVYLILKFIILAGVLVGFGYLYYKMNIKIANIIAIVGGYLIPLVVFAICFFKERGKDGRSA